MQWIEAKIYTTTQGMEPLTGSLLMIGLGGFVVEDPKDFEEFLNEENPKWDYIDESLLYRKDAEANVRIYLPDSVQGLEQLQLVKEALTRLQMQDTQSAWGRLVMELQNLNEQDWATAWKQYYHPTRVGQHLLICPSWESCMAAAGDVVVTLDPGMAFGTGTHHTTRLCMELLEEQMAQHSNAKVLDVGCGSGILAITASLLGAKEVVGCDIDEVAVKTAQENAALNGAQNAICFYQGSLTDKISGTYDIICANIVADIIILLCDDIKRYLTEGGVFIASGILDERKDEVLDKLRQTGLNPIRVHEDGGWVAIASV